MVNLASAPNKFMIFFYLSGTLVLEATNTPGTVIAVCSCYVYALCACHEFIKKYFFVLKFFSIFSALECRLLFRRLIFRMIFFNYFLLDFIEKKG